MPRKRYQTTEVHEINLKFETPKGMKLPDLNQLLPLMVKELVDKYPYYQNSFLEKDSQFWANRLGNEHVEYETAMDPMARKRKAINIANLALMAAETVDNG